MECPQDVRQELSQLRSDLPDMPIVACVALGGVWVDDKHDIRLVSYDEWRDLRKANGPRWHPV